MNLRRIVAAALVAFAAAACGLRERVTDSDITWVGTITTEGNVTTVVNESGSVWGGTARLVEEASIGVESGSAPYMLGQVRGVVAGDDRIYVLDAQVPTVRVYDFEGVHLADIGGPGEGPGEFGEPDNLAIGPDGAIYVRAGMQGRLTIFEADGRVRDTWPLAGGSMTSRPTVITTLGTVFMPGFVTSSEDVTGRRSAMIPWGPDGAEEGAIEEPSLDVRDYRLVARGEGKPTLGLLVPFAPRSEWTLAPSGAVVVGASTDYSFEVRHANGDVIKVQNGWDPIAVQSREKDWHKQQVFDLMRSYYPDWAWNGPEVPLTKPPFSSLLPDQSGRVWVYRPGHGSYNPLCDDPDPPRGTTCWTEETTVEAFGEDGRYLGDVEMPANLQERPPLFIRDDIVIGVVEDEAGTIMVKRYRLVLPGEEE